MIGGTATEIYVGYEVKATQVVPIGSTCTTLARIKVVRLLYLKIVFTWGNDIVGASTGYDHKPPSTVNVMF